MVVYGYILTYYHDKMNLKGTYMNLTAFGFEFVSALRGLLYSGQDGGFENF